MPYTPDDAVKELAIKLKDMAKEIYNLGIRGSVSVYYELPPIQNVKHKGHLTKEIE